MSFVSSLGEWLRKITRSFSDVSVNGHNITLTRHNGETEVIVTQDTVCVPATSSPLINVGAGETGTSQKYAREDHQHPLAKFTVIGQNDSPTKYWYKVASYKNTGVGQGHAIITFLVLDYFNASYRTGILKINARFNADDTFDSRASAFYWFVKTGYAENDFMIVCPTNAPDVIEIWTKLTERYTHRHFYVIGESDFDYLADKFVLYRKVGDGETAPTTGTQIIPSYPYQQLLPVVSTTASGLMSAEDKTKLDSIPDTTTGTIKYLREDGTWQVPPDTDTTYTPATQNSDGLMSANDKKLLDEAWSRSSGTVRKFEDGTMMQYTSRIWTASSTDYTSVTFSEPFIATPAVSLTFFSTTGATNQIRVSDITTTGFKWAYRNGTAYTNGASASFMALGRWRW